MKERGEGVKGKVSRGGVEEGKWGVRGSKKISLKIQTVVIHKIYLTNIRFTGTDSISTSKIKFRILCANNWIFSCLLC